MLKKLADRLHLTLKHGQNLKIVTRLGLNYAQLVGLRVFKLFHGIRRPIVHYYAVCWNEEKMLPFMFDYYEQFVDKFTIYDNYSDDSSDVIIKQHPNAVVKKFSMDGQINDRVYQAIKNNCWKQSRGKADYVIVCDMDEFLYHPDVEATLQRFSKAKVTLPTTEGYEMYSEAFPEYEKGMLLTDKVQLGVRSRWLDKSIFFDPHRIVDINFAIGAHRAEPTGIVRRNDGVPFKVLHYKHLGLDYLMERYRKLGERLSDYNRTNKFGTHYLAKEVELRAEMEQGLFNACNIIFDNKTNI